MVGVGAPPRWTSSLLVGALALASCPFPRPTQVPMRQQEIRAHADERSDAVAILLPGHGDSPELFVRHGFVAALTAADVDVILADAHSGYYYERTTAERLWSDVVASALAAGYKRVWLVGVSMGGLGALWTTSQHPGQIDGAVVLAPYLGRRGVLREVAAAGPEAWQPRAEAGAWDYELWRWLKQASAAKNPPIYLGYGEGERMAGPALLARLLGPGHVVRYPGGHDWATWAALWQDLVPRVPWHGEDPRDADAGPVLRTADELCRDRGYDFAFDPVGVPQDGSVELACGFGPGTPCEPETSRAYCEADSMIACTYGKMAATNCVQHCRKVGDPEGVLHDSGRCAIRKDEGACVCCDAGDPSCGL